MSMPLLSTVPRSTTRFSKVVGNGRSATHSRSTSAGSSSAQSNGQDSMDSPPMPILSTSVKSPPAWLPPQHSMSSTVEKSLFSAHSFQRPVASPADNSLYSNSTLFSTGTSVKQSPSLEEYFQEQHTKSYPISMIRPPPGLEDCVKPKESLVEAEAAQTNFQMEAMVANVAEMDPVFNTFEINDVAHNSEIPRFFEAEVASQNLRTHFQTAGDEVLQAMQQLPNESFSLLLNEASQQLTDDFFDAPHGFESQEIFMSSMQQSNAWDSCMEAALPMDSMMVLEEEYCAAEMELPTEEQLDMFAAEECQPSWHLQPSHGLQEAEIGSFECPTIGSQAHFFGTCRPCAFYYTKGCGNGAMCSFCHLCDEGERKRRAKDKRVAKKVAMWSGPTF